MAELKGIIFDSKDRIIRERPLRSRIKENFSLEDIYTLNDICLSNRYSDNNDKADRIHYILSRRGFSELGPGTNRYAMLKDNYVFKISLDHYGYDDNWTEFNWTKALQVYGATRTYETNGLIAVSQYINLLTLKEFHANKAKIRQILHWMSQKYLFADLGTIDKNYRNWGWDDNHELRFLDYGYVFLRDELLLRCTECGGSIGYDSNFDQMICTKCHTTLKIHDIRTMMEADDVTRKRMFEKKKPVTIKMAPGWDKEEDNSYVSMITVNK